mmetsp:Transcript_13863/g.29992  ORF Transcript_13863/g.29992 Transcript_13863/m.29992 type:complete len:200 (-) Transcript_13863:396-995(-)
MFAPSSSVDGVLLPPFAPANSDTSLLNSASSLLVHKHVFVPRARCDVTAPAPPDTTTAGTPALPFPTARLLLFLLLPFKLALLLWFPTASSFLSSMIQIFSFLLLFLPIASSKQPTVAHTHTHTHSLSLSRSFSSAAHLLTCCAVRGTKRVDGLEQKKKQAALDPLGWEPMLETASDRKRIALGSVSKCQEFTRGWRGS